MNDAPTFYSFQAHDISGVDFSFANLQNQMVLIVNTASQCGFTPQYKGLQELYQKYHEKGLTILAFPCNQFGSQEPGDAGAIKDFCDLKFNVTFPLMEKIDVNGENAHPLYRYLKEALPGIMGTKDIKWNFTKFLVDRQGKPVKRYAPQDTPEKIAKDLQELL